MSCRSLHSVAAEKALPSLRVNDQEVTGGRVALAGGAQPAVPQLPLCPAAGVFPPPTLSVTGSAGGGPRRSAAAAHPPWVHGSMGLVDVGLFRDSDDLSSFATRMASALGSRVGQRPLNSSAARRPSDAPLCRMSPYSILSQTVSFWGEFDQLDRMSAGLARVNGVLGARLRDSAGLRGLCHGQGMAACSLAHVDGCESVGLLRNGK